MVREFVDFYHNLPRELPNTQAVSYADLIDARTRILSENVSFASEIINELKSKGYDTTWLEAAVRHLDRIRAATTVTLRAAMSSMEKFYSFTQQEGEKDFAKYFGETSESKQLSDVIYLHSLSEQAGFSGFKEAVKFIADTEGYNWFDQEGNVIYDNLPDDFYKICVTKLKEIIKEDRKYQRVYQKSLSFLTQDSKKLYETINNRNIKDLIELANVFVIRVNQKWRHIYDLPLQEKLYLVNNIKKLLNSKNSPQYYSMYISSVKEDITKEISISERKKVNQIFEVLSSAEGLKFLCDNLVVSPNGISRAYDFFMYYDLIQDFYCLSVITDVVLRYEKEGKIKDSGLERYAKAIQNGFVSFNPAQYCLFEFITARSLFEVDTNRILFGFRSYFEKSNYNAYKFLVKRFSFADKYTSLHHINFAQTYIEPKINIHPLEDSCVMLNDKKIDLKEFLKDDYKTEFNNLPEYKILCSIFYLLNSIPNNQKVELNVPLEFYPSVRRYLFDLQDFDSLNSADLSSTELSFLAFSVKTLQKTKNMDLNLSGFDTKGTKPLRIPEPRAKVKFEVPFSALKERDYKVAVYSFEDKLIDVWKQAGGKVAFGPSLVYAYNEFVKNIPTYFPQETEGLTNRIDFMPINIRFSDEISQATIDEVLFNLTLADEKLQDKFLGFYSAYLTGKTNELLVSDGISLSKYVTPLETITIDEIKSYLPKDNNPLGVKLPRSNLADMIPKTYEWLSRKFNVMVLASVEREYGEVQQINFVRFILSPKDVEIPKHYSEFSSFNLSNKKIAFFDIPLGNDVLETETSAKYPSGYVAVKKDGNEYKLVSIKEYLFNIVANDVKNLGDNLTSEQLHEWAKNVRKKLNETLQQITVFSDFYDVYSTAIVPFNRYRVVVLDTQGKPIADKNFQDLVKDYVACYFSLKEQGYNLEVYKSDKGVFTLVPNTTISFADPGKKHHYSRLNSLASKINTPVLLNLPIRQVANDFGSNVFFVLSNYDENLGFMCDGGAWLNKNSALANTEVLVPKKVVVEFAAGQSEFLPKQIFEFLDAKKQLEESTGKKRDELLAKMKSCIIESDVGKIFIGSTLLNTNKFYITDVKVLGSEGYGVKLIVNGNMVISPKDVSFNFGYGGLKTVPDVVVIDKDDIDFVTMIKKGDERWVEVVLNSALTRLKEISRTSLNEQQKQKFDEIISQLKHVGIEPLSSQDGIYQFRAEKLSNDRIDKYEEIIKNTDELSKSVFNEGLVREVKLKANGKEYKFCGYLVRGYPTTISSTYRYPQSLGRLDAKFFEYISVKYDHDIALSLMKHLKPSNSSLVLSCYQALYSAFVDNSVSSNFEEFVPEKGLLERAKKEIKSAQELIKQVLYTTPKKIPLPADSNIVLMGKKHTHIYFPSLVRRNVEIPYKFLNKFERNALSVILNPTQENLEKYYRSLEQITFTKDGVLRSVFEVSNDTVYNFALVVPRGGMDYTTVEISPSSLIKFEGGQKLINDLKSGRDVYAIILRHPLISPDTVAVVKLKLSDTAPLKVHPVLWSVLKGDFDKDSAVVVTSYEMQQTLSSAFRKQQISFTAKLDEKIAAKKKSLAEDYSVSVEDIKKSFDKAKPVVSNDAFNTASAIGIALRILTGDLHWSLYELREFVRTAYEQGDITPQQYLKYTEILWKIEQQPISGKKLAEIFNEKEKEMLNNSKLTIAEKLGVIEKAFERNGLNVVLNLTKWQDRKNVTPVSLGLLLNWQDYVSENAKLSSKDLNEFVVLTNEYFNMRRYGLSKYREGIITEMTRAELLKDVPAGWHTLNSLATVHPLSYWEVALKENVGIEIVSLPSQIVIEPQHPQSNPSTIPSTEGIFLRQGKEVTSSPRLVEDNVGDKVVSPLPQEKEKFIFIQKGFPVNLDKGIIIVDKLSNARKFNDFVFTPGEIKKTIEVYNKSVSGKLKTPTFFDKRQNYLVQKLGYDKKTDEYFAIANN